MSHRTDLTRVSETRPVQRSRHRKREATIKIVYFASGSPDCPILMLTDLRNGDASALQQTVGLLARGQQRRAVLPTQFLQAHEDVQLAIEVTEHDIGVQGHPPHFSCRLTATSWHNVEELLEPFLDATCTGYQWLDETSPISLLLSPTGQW